MEKIDVFPKAYADEATKPFIFIPPGNYGMVPLNEDGSINMKMATPAMEM